MTPDTPQTNGRKSEAEEKTSSHKHPPSSGHVHSRFLTGEEFDALLGDEATTAIDAELAMIAFERHLPRLARQRSYQDIAARLWPPDISGNIPFDTPPILRPGRDLPPSAFERIFKSVSRARPNHHTMDPAARTRFNNALQMAHQAGTYQSLAAIHT